MSCSEKDFIKASLLHQKVLAGMLLLLILLQLF